MIDLTVEERKRRIEIQNQLKKFGAGTDYKLLLSFVEALEYDETLSLLTSDNLLAGSVMRSLQENTAVTLLLMKLNKTLTKLTDHLCKEALNEKDSSVGIKSKD